MSDNHFISQANTALVSTEDALGSQPRQPYIAPTVEKLGISATELGGAIVPDGSISS